MGDDEEGTLAALKAHRRDIIDPKISEHHGRIVKTTGDGILVEFASAVDAVRCALEVQKSMFERNANLPENRRMDFRIGINVGDIVIDAGDIFGDGVNVAARLESIAERGGVCISRQVLDQIDGKVPVSVRELGRQNLKNIARPIEVYAINLDDAAPPGASVLAAANLHQKIRYCAASDGVRLAYATVGSGPPLMKSAHG
jgi:class 3 adenylate cyclase